jgi:hypothetical protein
MKKEIDEIDEKRARIAAIGRRVAAISQPASLHLSLPKFDLPKVELPQFAAIGADLEAASKRWREAMAPLTAVGERFRRQMEAMQATLAPLAEQIKWIEEQERQCERLERAGWLPHKSSPFDMLKSNVVDDAGIDAAVGEYYASHWPDVSATLRSEIDECALDDEAKECFAEALAAHDAGLYRCPPRLLFPEIERVARTELHGGELERITSQDTLVQAIGGLTPAEMASTGMTGLRFYKKLTEHLYRHLKDADRVAAAKADPVPNRHAAVHGLISYTSAKSSLNALLVADYLLQAISTIKRLAGEERLRIEKTRPCT